VGGSGLDDFVRVRKSDLEKLTTEVMQLRDFLPRVLNGDLIETLHEARTEQLAQEQEQLRQECLHLQSRLGAVQTECQKEREEKLLLREQLWQSGAELQQQADFCSDLGSAACSLLVSPSISVCADGFVGSLDDDANTLAEDHNPDHQFVLAWLEPLLVNVAAVACGRDFLSCLARDLLDSLMKLLELMSPGVFPKLKVLMLMALYNVSISVKGLKCLSENPGLLPLILTLLDDGDWEVCLHSLRLLQSVLMEEEVLLLLGSSLLDPDLRARVSGLTSSERPSLRLAAQQTLEDLLALQQGPQSKRMHSKP
uniref:Heat shock transcription factor 2 binding protein n=1 Tax=Gasterosteus aculeatus aculeatus TaxID=481459 RepID=G3PRI9_GASAC